MRVLVTGAAGFVGYFLSQRLLADGHQVYGVDNINDYYDVQLKHDRLANLSGKPGFTFQKLDLADQAGVLALFQEHQFDCVVNLAAQAGVRYSLENPFAYSNSNLVGFVNILEGCRHSQVSHLVYASSSSVYGANKKVPFSVEDNVDHPVSLYAATKKANELMAHTYSHLYGLPTTGLRFFTVYGPMGRPDMAYFKFVQAIEQGRPIDVYNHGDMKRDFTYIDDIVDGIQTLVEGAPLPADDETPHRVYNLGNNNPEQLLEMISLLEAALGRQARKNLLPMQPGDVLATYADIRHSTQDFSFVPKTDLATGLKRFAAWYRQFYPERTS